MSLAAQLMDHARDYSASEVLKDGTRVTIRALRPTDLQGLIQAFRLLDRNSIYTRFFTHRSGFSKAEIDRAINVDFVNEVALVVTTKGDQGETIMASGRYVVVDKRGAELAFLVGEAYRGRGIASRLLACLARLARGQGLARLEAAVLAQNRAMLVVLERCGLPMRQRREGGVVHVTLALAADAPGSFK